jgi:hypothetical protein
MTSEGWRSCHRIHFFASRSRYICVSVVKDETVESRVRNLAEHLDRYMDGLVVNDRHLRKRPMIFTTNQSLREWGRGLHDEDTAVILDRLLERRRLIHLDGPSGITRHLNLEETLPAGAESVRISRISVREFSEPTTGNCSDNSS